MNRKSRWEHPLTPVKRVTVPREWLFFDCENEVRHADDCTIEMPLAFGYALYWRLRDDLKTGETEKWCRFTSPDGFVDFLEEVARKRSTLRVVAYNVAHDVCTLDLLAVLERRGWTITGLYEKAQTVFIRAEKEGKHIIILDGLNWFRGPLAAWGQMLGIPKVEVDWEHPDPQALEERCRRDVLILREMLRYWIRLVLENRLGPFRDTLASQAFAAYRHRFMTCPIHIHNNPQALRLERDGYAGGMVRVWKVGEFRGHFYQLDVNSMYPYVMAQHTFPTRLVGYGEKLQVDQLKALLKRYHLIADVTIRPDAPCYRRLTTEHRVTYPMYPFRGVLCTPELVRVVTCGEILAVHRAAWYRYDRIFTPFVTELYGLRCEYKRQGEEHLAQMTKLILNSLYGKFGGRSGGLRPAPEIAGMPVPIGQYYDSERRKMYNVCYFSHRPGATPYIEEDTTEAFNSFPAIAAHVTAYGRMMLFRLCEVAGVENVYYTDTDSLIVNVEGYKRLESFIAPYDLGFLKLEHEATELEVWGRKDYRIGDKVVLKGVQTIQNRDGVPLYQREIWPTILGWYRNRRRDVYTVYIQNMTLSRRCFDGWIFENGDVEPFTTPPTWDKDPYELVVNGD